MTTPHPTKSAPAPSVTYTELPDFDTVEQRIYAGCRRFISVDMLEPIHNLIRDAIDADRAMRAQAAPASQDAATGLKDGDIAALVNRLRDIAIEYSDTQQLRERIASEIRPRAAWLVWVASQDAEDAARYRLLRAQAAPAAVASPLTKLQRKAIAVCFTSDKVSVSEVQRKLSISYADAQTLCQSIVDLGLTDELELAPSLKRGAPAPHPAPVAQGDARVQGLIAAADYIDGPASGYAAEHSYTEPSPMAKVAAALRQKAEQEDAAYQARRSDQGLMESEWGPMEDAPPHEDPPMHVAVVEGDDAVRTLQWNRDVAAFAYPVGTLLYAAHPAAPVAQGDAEAAAREAHSRR